jgi:hypothetical protein
LLCHSDAGKAQQCLVARLQRTQLLSLHLGWRLLCIIQAAGRHMLYGQHRRVLWPCVTLALCRVRVDVPLQMPGSSAAVFAVPMQILHFPLCCMSCDPAVSPLNSSGQLLH